MSGKRGASDQITRENFREFEDEDDDVPSQPSRASADVMAKRKILKPRGRLGKTGSTPSSGFSFGTIPADKADDKPANPFGGFGSFGKPAAEAPKPAFSFGKPAETAEEEAPKANPFGFLKTTAPSNDTEKANSVISFVNGNQTSQSSSLVSTKTTTKATKIKALNDTFYDKITQEKQANPVSNFTPILRKYIDYYDKIDRDVDMSDADAEPQQSEQKALPAAPSTPSFNFGNTTKPSFNFGQATPPSVTAPTSQPAIEDAKPSATESSSNSQEPIAVDSNSDSDSDDDIKVEGPKFTVSKLPTTKDSAFKLTSDATSQKPSGSGPSFTFAAAGDGKKFDSPFKLTKPAEDKKTESKQDEQPKKTEDNTTDSSKPSAFGDATKNNFTWSPGQPINFASSASSDTTTTKPTTQFNFGASTTPSKDTSEAASKPAFSFGKPAASTEEKKDDAKPAFSFGSNSTTTKPTFNFGSTTSTTTDSTSKPTFNFGSTSTSTESKPTTQFNFGGSSTAPKFNFGGAAAATAPASSTFNFSFSGSKPAESETNNNKNNDDDDAVPEEEAKVDFKPVAELGDKVEEKTGEEEEEVLYTKRAKLMLYNPSDSANPYVNKGLGLLKVLKHKETNKSRILVRADGSDRVILNTAIAKQFTYSGKGKGLVSVPTVGAEGKLETYMIKVKTEEDAQNFVQSLTDAQSAL
ncbi:Nucleoporin NUP2 [Cyberlindnera fabianii]|uniref:Nucleoporin NUP2 n=1 Tax=Cyberlindnera fabianii TaxID=36022 RepID=A0A1V2LFY6_CYBFA|nr:Nucleoporin NUP2 [Cyberlindnera fabianii]